MSRVFTIVPAAGLSRRMGRPKLLLPWQDRRIIDCVLDAWTGSRADHVIVVCRKSDTDLRSVCGNWPVKVVCPANDPQDMKASIQHGLRYVEEEFEPVDTDHWMLAPADLPGLTSHMVDQLIDAKRTNEMLASRFGDHQSHPVLFPWASANDVFELGPDQGINVLIQRTPVRCVTFPAELYPRDIDTPEDYGNR